MENFVYYLIELGISIREEVLGKQYPVKIHNLDAFIEFPRLSPNLTHTTYSEEKYLLPPTSVKGSVLNHRSWGIVSGICKLNKKIISISWAILLIPTNNQEEEKVVIDQKTDIILKIVSVFKQYIGIYSKEAIVSKPQFTPYGIFRDSKKYKSYAQGNVSHFLSEKTVKGITESGIDEVSIKKCIDKVSVKLKLPPIVYQLLNEARRYFGNQEYRPVIFECATAAEILLTDKIDNYISRKHNAAFASSLLDRYNGLGSKYDLASRLELFNQQYDIAILAKYRNDAIHAGKEVTREMAQHALEITDNFIYSEVTHLFEA